MAFAHDDFYHSPATLKRISNQLLRDGVLRKKEKSLLDDFIYASTRFKIGGKPFDVEAAKGHKSSKEEESEYYEDSKQQKVVRDMRESLHAGKDDPFIFAKTRSTSEKVVQALGRFVASNRKKDKVENLKSLLQALQVDPTPDRLDMVATSPAAKSPPRGGSNSRRVVYFSDLKENEKEQYLSFLVENNVKFWKESSDGMYTATIRLEPQREKKAPASSKKLTSSEKKPSLNEQRQAAANMTKGKHCQAHLFSRHAGRPPKEEERMINALYGSTGDDEVKDEFASYQTFSKLITIRDKLKPPKKRPVTWLLRLIEEIYDARFIHDSADFKDDGTAVPGEETNSRLSHQFPIFVVDFFSKRYGLRTIVDQNCWDLLFNVNLYREKYLEVAIFGRFLEEFYDPDDLLFFLYVRSTIQKEIGINFRAHWSELGRKSLDDTVWLSFSSCVKVSRVVFVSESDPLFRVFMDMIEARDPETGKYKHLHGAVSRKSDTRRIEVIQFLHLALAEYHSTRPAEGEDEAARQTERSEREAGENSFGVGGKVLIESKDEQDRLYKEAEAHFENTQRDGGEVKSSGDDNREQRIRDLEDRIRAEIMSRKMDTPGYQGEDDDDDEDDAVDAGGDEDEDGNDAGLLIQAISESIEKCNERYLSDLIRENLESSGLPDAIQDEIRREVQLQLESKVEMVLESVVDAAMSDEDGDDVELVSKFKSCRGLPDGREFRSRVGSFCSSVVNSDEVTQEIEPLVGLLITYALQNFRQEGGRESSGRAGERVHISRSGSIDIQMD